MEKNVDRGIIARCFCLVELHIPANIPATAMALLSMKVARLRTMGLGICTRYYLERDSFLLCYNKSSSQITPDLNRED